MALYEIEGPDGSVFEIEGPDDATDEQITAFAEQQFSVDRARAGAINPVEGMSDWQRLAAAAGAGAERAWRGLRQSPLPSDILSFAQTGRTPRLEAIKTEEAQARELEAPLMETGAGKIGNVLGTVGAIAPTALIPGASTLAGAALIGGATGFATTPGSLKERRGAGVGGAIGGPAGIAAGRILGAGSRALGNRAAQAGAENSVINATVRDALDAGYRLPPSEMVQSGLGRFVARGAESLGGKAATAHTALRVNQRVTNSLIRRDLGLGGRGQISRADLSRAMTPHVAVYRDAANVSPAARQALHDWRAANDLARRYTREYNANYTVAAEDAAGAARHEAARHLATIEQEVTAAGHQNLVKRLARSRVELARIGTIEDAINEDTGNVSAAVLARALDRGIPLTGGTERAARFARAFPDFAKPPKSLPGVSKLDAWTVAGGLASTPVTGPAGMAIAALPVASYGARHALLSRPAQAMAVPAASPGALRINIGRMLETEEGRRALGATGLASAILANQQ